MSKMLQDIELKIARELAKAELVDNIDFGEEDDRNFNETVIQLTEKASNMYSNRDRDNHYMEMAYQVIDDFVKYQVRKT